MTRKNSIESFILQGFRVQGVELAARPINVDNTPRLLLLKEGDEHVLLLGHPPVLLIELSSLCEDLCKRLGVDGGEVEPPLDHLQLVKLVALGGGEEEVGLGPAVLVIGTRSL